MGGGHFNLTVTTQEFVGKSTLAKHKLVLSAIAPLMSGPSAPVHAIDSLDTMLPTA
jgi:stress-induced morphogen